MDLKCLFFFFFFFYFIDMCKWEGVGCWWGEAFVCMPKCVRARVYMVC